MTFLIWALFLLLILGMLALDLGVFHRRPGAVSARAALAWAAFWIAVALGFNVVVFHLYEHDWLGVVRSVGHDLGGREAALQFLTGYLVEYSLSLDNVFVIAMILAYFRVPAAYQHRTLFWGILGALLMRGVMIGAGAAMIRRFDWTVYLFGAILLLTAGKMLFTKEEAVEPERNPLVRIARRLYPVTKDFHGEHFFVREGGRRAVTPLFLVLLVVESSDVLFAVDSVPAIFAVTSDPFLVFTSNAFALLGLRSLYFAIAAVVERFRFVKFSLVFILAFVGIKMILSHHFPIPTAVSLPVIAGMLVAGILASWIFPRRNPAPVANPGGGGPGEGNLLTWRQAKRVVAAVFGVTLLLIGVALLFLPGPGILFLTAALAVLGTEFLWARRLLKRIRAGARSVGDRIFGVAAGPDGGKGVERGPDSGRGGRAVR